jgi:hypothetical protein
MHRKKHDASRGPLRSFASQKALAQDDNVVRVQLGMKKKGRA